ncbi:transglutaminase-like domain-containing protein [Rubrivivax gelatinosus]|uniref:Transglutaminase n=1 Tax=Rubrivivax gelatinosus TaxID=28068 RepID=A0ABS1DV53_RUBGE|nr:transglutaminase family protein [Rubrivivax gelatinosus]MBK1713075.1 transglutaminase [Rubrivivax gelatinosus]
MIRLQLSIELNYEVADPAGADMVFNIHAARTACQTVESERLVLSQPITPDVATDPATASRFMRVHAEPGPLHVNYDAVVCIRHHLAEPDTLQEVPVRCLPLDVMPYVYPSRYCQSDRLLRLAAEEFGGFYPGYSRVLAVQHWVQKQISFQSNTSDSTTSAVDTLIGRVGVCRDFAHLMIALCRALNIPARIVSGTDYGADPALGPPDFHAYAEVYLGERWYLFDPSGTAVPMGLVRLGTGRDAADVAFATLFGRLTAAPPRILATALEGDGAELPRHCREALSTAAGPGLAADGSAPFGASGTTAQPIPLPPH